MQINKKYIKIDLSKLNLNWNQADNLIPAIHKNLQKFFGKSRGKNLFFIFKFNLYQTINTYYYLLL